MIMDNAAYAYIAYSFIALMVGGYIIRLFRMK